LLEKNVVRGGLLEKNVVSGGLLEINDVRGTSLEGNVISGGLLEINDVRGTSLEKNVVRGGLLEINDFFFVLARSQVNLLRYLTQESYVPTSMLSTNKIDYATRRNIDVSEVPCSHSYSCLASFFSSTCLVLSRVPA